MKIITLVSVLRSNRDGESIRAVSGKHIYLGEDNAKNKYNSVRILIKLRNVDS